MDPVELTVDQLAARVGITVRTVRAYTTRGLLPPPRLRGRTGYYGPAHVARLELVRDMQAQGFTLAAVESLLGRLPEDAGVETLAAQRALLTPWLPEEPEEMSDAEFTRRAGQPVDDVTFDQLARLGVAVRLPDGRVRVRSPALLRAGRQIRELGIPLEAMLATERRVREQARGVADDFVDLFRTTVWRPFAEQGMPADQWPDISRTVEQIKPLATQVLLTTFLQAMDEAIGSALQDEARDLGRPRRGAG